MDNKINKEQIKKTADLMKLYVKSEEMDSFVKKINSLLNMIDELQEVDTDSQKPLNSVLEEFQRTRAYKKEDEDTFKNVLHNMPKDSIEIAKTTRCFSSPKSID